jgi:hypothetical protein
VLGGGICECLWLGDNEVTWSMVKRAYQNSNTYLMVRIAYHLPYSGLLECDQPWLICAGRQIGGVVGLPSVDMLIIIIMV